MVTEWCSHCNLRYTRMAMNTDFVHDCSNSPNPVARQEDILVVHTSYSDFDGSGGKGPHEVMMQGTANKIFGTLGDIEGEKSEEETRRGNPTSRFRQRRHLQFIDKS